ncbi:MAG: hypothetical protein GX298_01710 [Planctomycetes bacterium]|nr:hypothetical protein [Planctomycetota bacterium]
MRSVIVLLACVIVMGLGANAATITTQAEEPIVEDGFIVQLLTCASDNENINGPGQTYSGANDDATYVANDRSTQGQTFTMASGGTLYGIWVKHVNWEDYLDNGTWYNFSDGDQITVRISSISETTLTVLSSEVATMAAESGFSGGGDNGTGLWLHIALETPVNLGAGTYAFDLTSYGPWFEMDGLEAGPYDGGEAYTTAAKEDTDLSGASWHVTGDRTFVLEIDTAGPYNPKVMPENPEGSVGILISNEEAEVTLSWMAGEDPDEERGYPVNPDILGHYIFLSSGNPGDDPNVHLFDYVPQVHAEDPYETDPYNEYGPIVLSQGTVYYWQIVHEILNHETGEGYPLGDPNNIAGSVWKFTTIGVIPRILVHPKSMYVDVEGNASFSVTGSAIATAYRWFKVGDPEDIALTDGGPYSGTQTDTLLVTGATLAEEGQYYCIAYNGDPDEGGTPSQPSEVAWLWIPRLLIHYPLDTVEVVQDSHITPDIASGFDMTLMHINNAEGMLPSLVEGVPELGGSGLFFNNSDREDPNNTWGQYATAGDVDMEERGNALTISFWVQWVGNNGDWQGIINRRGSWNNADMMWRIDKNPTSGEISFEREGGAGRVATTLVEDEWHHITVTYDAASLTTRMYNNGTLVATGSGFTYGTGVNSGFKLGCNNDNGSEFFYGVLDDVKVYNYARTTEQIAQDYLAVRGGWVCNYELYDLPYDFNNDCIVDLADFAIFAEKWLDSYRIYPE